MTSKTLKKHKGNMPAIISFALLSVVVLVSALSWTSATKHTTRERATQSTKQYSLITCSNILKNAIVLDIGNMTANKGNDDPSARLVIEEEMLETMREARFPKNSEGNYVYTITDPTNIIENIAIGTGKNVEGTEKERGTVDMQEELDYFLQNSRMTCILETSPETSDGNPTPADAEPLRFISNTTNEEENNVNMDLEPFNLRIKLQKGTEFVEQTYTISDAYVEFIFNADGNTKTYAAINTAGAAIEHVGQIIGHDVISKQEIDGTHYGESGTV